MAPDDTAAPDLVAPGRRWFVPSLVAGLGGGVLAAVASNNAWAAGGGDKASALTASSEAGTAPLAGALALVVLAAWGVLLVVRGRFRSVMAWLAVVVAIAYAVAVVWGRGTVLAGVRDELDRNPGLAQGDVTVTWWWWVAVVAALVVLVAGTLAVRFVGDWPEMGARYDAPGARRTTGTPANNLDMWKALDEGRDPTA